ncbi:MAG: CPBP family intramembrane metalloprotease [Synergistaceae bacterium]|jgi:membrane protease YdiL (CAAX protease family)|nr:CPBP family intramembrane metalloprotease [Synergistaceae bacterium]
MDVVVRNIIPTIAGLLLIFTPFQWCRFRKEDPDDYGLNWKFTGHSLLECLAVSAVVLVPLTFVSMDWPFESLPRSSSLYRILNLGSAGIAAAIIEEIFYRGWVQPLFRRRFNAFCAVVFTSVIFALSHIFVAQTPFLFAVFFPGCIMGFLRERHGNIATPTLFHAFGNLWAIWFAPLRWPSVDWMIGRFQDLIWRLQEII